MLKVKVSVAVMSNSFDPMDYSLSGSSVHGILQARIMEWVTRSLGQGNSPTQGLNPHLLRLLYCMQADSLPTALQQGSIA